MKDRNRADVPVLLNLLKRHLHKTRIIGPVQGHAGFWMDRRKIKSDKKDFEINFNSK